MTPLKIGACLKAEEIAPHRDWLFDSARDIELQDFVSHAGLSGAHEDRIAAAISALDGHTGRRGRERTRPGPEPGAPNGHRFRAPGDRPDAAIPPPPPASG